MKHQFIAAATVLAAAAGVGIVNAPPADAYATWRNGTFYGDTSYSGNVPGVYVQVVGRRDISRQIYYLRVTLQDTVTDGNRAAVRVRGWDKQTNRFVSTSSIQLNSGARGQTVGTITMGTSVVDTIIVQDCILGKTCGSNSLAVFRRYPS